jgi:type II secretory pathway component GspD/PulD (secretin)
MKIFAEQPNCRIPASTVALLGLALLCSALHPSWCLSIENQSENWLDSTVSINFSAEPLNKVLSSISKQADIVILYDQQLSEKEVSGQYNGVRVLDAINRIFDNENTIIQTNDEKKLIIVQTFGAKNYIWAKAESVSLDDLENVEALNTLNREQFLAYLENLKKEPEAIVPGTEMTRAELDQLNKQQYQAYSQRAKDPEAKVSGTDMTRMELDRLNEQQYENYLEHINDSQKFFPNLRNDTNLSEPDISSQQQYCLCTRVVKRNSLIGTLNFTERET